MHSKPDDKQGMVRPIRTGRLGCDQPIAAVILTPETTGRKLASEIVSGEFAEWSVPVLRGGFNAAYGEKREGFDKFVESFQPTQSPIFPNNEIVLYFDEERLKSDAFTR